MIYTSYFAKLRNLPEDIVPVAICGGVPKWYKGKVYKVLAPEFNSFRTFKVTGDADTFSHDYNQLVLAKLNADSVVKELEELTGSKDICLVCFEKSDDFCHRHLVADWLIRSGYNCYEYH